MLEMSDSMLQDLVNELIDLNIDLDIWRDQNCPTDDGWDLTWQERETYYVTALLCSH